jgi:pimeloyl-ACP methyl ester carboxylesterase
MNFLLSLTYIFILFTFWGCSFLDLKEDLDNQNKLKNIVIDVVVKEKTDTQIIVALVNEVNLDVINYRIIKESETVSFMVTSSRYKVYVFEDENNDYKFSKNEKMVISNSLDIKNKSVAIRLKLIATLSENEIKQVKIMKQNLSINLDNAVAYLGTITSLDSKNFSQMNIKKGMWEPYSFAQDIPFGLFLLEEYDPNRKVLLFVHGTSGSPQNFRYLIKNIDRKKYQAMVAYYPTGVSLSLASEYLARSIKELKIKFKFNTIDIVAHSMGGIVSRNIINILYEDECFVDTFITISSPLAGDSRANGGVEYSPVVMPVWKDIASNSEFLKDLYRTPIKDKLDYYLLFGFKSDSNDDGVVSIASQLRMEAQKEAKMVRGFHEDHMSILSSKEVSKLINNLLVQ